MKIALQLYTLRNECAADFFGTLSKAAKLGYRGVELAGTHGCSAREIRDCLDRNGLTAVSAHVGYEDFADLERVAETYDTLDVRRLVIPYYPMENPAQAAAFAEKVRELLPKVRQKGFELLYHNHDFEMKKFGDGDLWDVLKTGTEGELGLEADLFWVFAGGQNPVDFMNRHRDVLRLVHLKDGIGRDTKALGEGDMDFPPLLAALADSGLEWVIVENDEPAPDGISDAARSIDFLRRNYGEYFE